MTVNIHAHILTKEEINQILIELKEKNPETALEDSILALFQQVNDNKLIGKNGVSIALENAILLLRYLKLDQKTYETYRDTLRHQYHESQVIHKSTKGFIAIDIDGTALVEKIDKNPRYGLTNSGSNLRKSLIEYLKLAQNAGYDIVVLTARPQFVEKGLTLFSERLGTKPTEQIIADLELHGFYVFEIERATSGLKGSKMEEVLEEYKQHGAENPVGILFDDQLKQVRDVHSKDNTSLSAYDINSPVDLEQFLSQMNVDLDSSNLFHNLEELVSTILLENEELSQLQASAKQIDRINHPEAAKLIEHIIDELAFRLYEAKYRKYQPEIEWVNTATKAVQSVVNKLLTESTFNPQDINNISSLIFNSNAYSIKPNSNCDQVIKHLINYMTTIQIIGEILKKCTVYQNHLKNILNAKTVVPVEESLGLAQNKLRLIDQFIEVLTSNKNPTTALSAFKELFTNEVHMTTLKQHREGMTWYNDIRNLLAKIPLIGILFKSQGDVLATSIESEDLAASSTLSN